jgi:hypothetical protein
MASLGLLAIEMATVLEVIVQLRRSEAERAAAPRTGHDLSPLLQRVAERLPRADEKVGATVTRLLMMADDLLADTLADGDG